MSDDVKKDETTITRRRMLMRLGLAAGAIYAAPVLMQLSEARASSFSPPSGPRRRRRSGSFSAPSFSGPRKQRSLHGAEPAQPRRRRIKVSSFSR